MSPKCPHIVLFCATALLCFSASYQVSSAAGQTVLPHFDPAGTGPLYTDLANGTTTAVPSLKAFYIDQMAITMDGVLDDEARVVHVLLAAHAFQVGLPALAVGRIGEHEVELVGREGVVGEG